MGNCKWMPVRINTIQNGSLTSRKCYYALVTHHASTYFPEGPGERVSEEFRSQSNNVFTLSFVIFFSKYLFIPYFLLVTSSSSFLSGLLSFLSEPYYYVFSYLKLTFFFSKLNLARLGYLISLGSAQLCSEFKQS